MADVPGVGGGKIRPKRSTSSKKPYSRAASQRKSLFSRVTDSFKTFLNPLTPKWLSSRLTHDRDREDQGANQPDSSSVTVNHQERQEVHTNNNYKRSPLSRPHLKDRSSPTTSLKYFVTPPDTPLEEQQPKDTPSGGKHDLLKHLEMSSKRQKMLNDPSPQSERSNLTKEIIYLTTNDNASVASSSGCSSSVQVNNQRGGSSVDQEGSQKNLWSSSMDSLASSRASSQQQVTMGSHKRPRFNPAIFSIPSMGSPSRPPDTLQSSFYQGPVQFGGANASLRSAYFATPYKVPSVTKVKVRHINHRRASGASSRSSSTSSKNSQSDLSAAGMSSTAKKILQTLERMSSPLNDARKIPSVARTPSTFMAERQQRRRTIAGSSMLNKSLHAPPTMGLTTPVSARIRKSVKMPLNNSLLAPAKQQDTISQKSSDDKSASESRTLDSNVISTRGMPAPLASMSSALPKSQRHFHGESSLTGGGKIKSQRRVTSHYSAMHEEDKEEEEPDLPAVALPLTGSSNLPSFNFNKSSLVTSTPALRAPNKLKDLSQPEFNFASPVVKTSNMEQVKTSSNAPKFQFSSPPSRVTSASESKETPKSSPLSNFNVGSKKTTPSLMFAPDPKVVSEVRASKQKSPPSPAQKSEEKAGFRPAESLKPGSVMDILAGKTTKTTKAPGTLAESWGSSSITNPIKQVKSGWECETCMVQNDDSDEKCAACETPKSGVKTPTTFSASKSNKGWECDTCLVPNDPGTEKCVACETPRPGSTSASSASVFKSNVLSNVPNNSSFTFGISKNAPSDPVRSKSKSKSPPAASWGSLAKKSSGEWECPSCLVSNESSCDTCEACTTPRPGSKSKAPLSRTNNGKSAFSFGIPSSSAAKSDAGKSSEFKFGVNRSTNDSKVVNATSGWGNQFKKSTEMWECEMCMVTNPIDKKTCEACESPKPGTEKQDSLNSSFKFGQASAGLYKFGIPDSKPKKDNAKGNAESGSEKIVTFGVSSNPSQSAPEASRPAPTFSFGAPSTAAPVAQKSQDGSETKQTASAISFGQVSQSNGKNPSETAPKPLYSFGLPNTQQAAPGVKADKKPPAATAATTTTVAAFGVPPPSYANVIAKTAATGLSAFKPPFGTSVPTSQAAFPGFGVQATTATTSKQSGAMFGSIKTAGPAAEAKPEEKKSAPSFSFGAQPSTATSFQFSGSTGTAPPAPPVSDTAPPASFSFGSKSGQGSSASSASAPTFNFGSKNTAPSSNMFGSATPTTSGTTTAPTPFTGFGSSSQPTQQKSDSSTVGFKGFNFTGSQPASTTSGFGSNTLKTNDPAPFGSNNQAPSIFSTSKTGSTPFGGTSTPGGIFSSGAAPKPAFGSATVNDSTSGIPKPSFSFGQPTSNQAVEQKQAGFSGFPFAGSNPASNSSTPSSSGFNFGAAAPKPAPAFGSNPSTGFQFGASQQQSNGVFNFGSGSNQPKPEQASENKSGVFVFGSNTQAGSNPAPQQASAGFSFGASSSSAGSFTFSGNQSATPQGPMFSMGEGSGAPPNQNPFSASVGRSTTPVQGGRRVIRQARRKLRK